MPMANVSIARKVGLVARVAAQQARRNRLIGAAIRACRTTAGHFGPILHQLWLEVTGFVFLALAAIGALSGVREYAQYRAHTAGPDRVLVAIVFTLTFAWFGMTSFWRVRRKR